jgi:hypothetical protein
LRKLRQLNELTTNKAASAIMLKAAFIFFTKNACQLEGSDHGGRDAAAELALAGTIDVQVPDDSCNRLGFGASLVRRRELYTPTNIRQRLLLNAQFPM